MKTKEMILTPTTPLNPPKNTYILEVSVMHGDADKNEDIEFEFKNKEYFIEMYNFYDKAYDLDDEEGRRTFYEKKQDELTEHDERSEALEEWPGDCTADYQYLTSIQGVGGRYYDENGREFRIKFK